MWRTVAGAAAVSTLLLGAGACDKAAPQPGADPAASGAAGSAQSPRDALLAAAPSATGKSYRYVQKDVSGVFAGVVDPTAGSASMETSVAGPDGIKITLAFASADAAFWTKIGFSRDLPTLKIPKGWTKVDTAKLKDKTLAVSLNGSDPTNAKAIFSLADAVTGSAGAYQGTADLSKLPAGTVLTAEELTALGELAKTVPFSATVDVEGRLSNLTLKMPAAGKVKADDKTITYSAYGTATLPAMPVDGKPAPASVYQILNAG
ncbi:hypothetical protein [Pilimelia columellifera]|uniref:Lipoprotein n=1 Tax=Pilimelia columellifera subsp. columellifera TaxID=706583 RepID=A0ABN3N7E0_9ACTN